LVDDVERLKESSSEFRSLREEEEEKSQLEGREREEGKREDHSLHSSSCLWLLLRFWLEGVQPRDPPLSARET